jgi:predicted ATPase/DNA-binding SARP family transcriptional activator
MSSQMRLHIGLLGPFRLSLNDQTWPIEAQRRKKSSDIIKLLALQPGQRLHREQVLEALWPDLDEKSGMNNLHQNLYHARRMLEPGLSRGARSRFLTFEHETLVLYAGGPVEVDYSEFLRLVNQARRQGDAAYYEAAIRLYQGDLLPENIYDDWTEPHRDEARSLYLAALLELARRLEQRGDLALAGHFLEQAIAKEPTTEAAHLALMQIYARSGRRMEAIQQFQTLREALVQELGEEPDEHTRAVYEQVLQQLPSLLEPPAQVEPKQALLGWVPVPLSPLIGREAALQETLQLLSTTRCLTLTGAAGAGKTRLAQELASRLQGQYEGGVWWIELVALSDAQMILPAIAQVLGVHGTSQPPLKNLLERLLGRKTLLVLDNCEHLIDGCAEAAVQLLRSLPQLQLLATSREALGMVGEIAWVVAPLEVPDPEAELRPKELDRFESVRFLLGRIRQQQPRYELNARNAVFLAQICRRLEGLPLALELAATWVGMLSLEQVVARLDNSLRLLTRGHRGGERHHQTLEAALQWSYNLLGESEKNLFVRLSVFVGGWSLEAAEMLCADQGFAAGELAEWHSRLVRTSMVLALEEGSPLRFRMLEPVRQFGLARLETLGLAEATRKRLLECYLAEATTIAPRLTGPEQAHWYSYLSTEYENIRAVLLWSQRAEIELGLQLAARLWRFWQVKGHAQEMLAWFEETLPQAPLLSPAILAEACNAAGIMARTCGRYTRSFEYLEQALASRRALGDRRGEAIALNNLAVSARDQADYPKVEHYARQSLAIAREIGDQNLEALGLMNLGVAMRGQTQNEVARTYFQHSLAIFSELGEKRSIAALHNFLGGLAQDQGHWQEAHQLYQQSLELNQELGDYWGLGISTHNLATLWYEQQDYDRAWEVLLQSLNHYYRAGVRHGLNECFETMARIASRRGDLEQSSWALGVLAQLEESIGLALSDEQRALREQMAEELILAMGRPAYLQAHQKGRSDSLENVYRRIFSGSLA